MIRSWHKTNVIIPYTPNSLDKIVQLYEYDIIYEEIYLKEMFLYKYNGESIYYMERK